MRYAGAPLPRSGPTIPPTVEPFQNERQRGFREFGVRPLVDHDAWLASVEQALQDGDATLSTDLGDHHETTSARLWHGQVLVDWEPDTQAGGCLLRVELMRRLIALQAVITQSADNVTIRASGRVVEALSPHHADLVRRLGGARRVDLRLSLELAEGVY